LKHFGFAKQRFDSTADPQGKLALMLLPVCTLLAHISSDERSAPAQRERARAMLKNFEAKFCIALGVSADWGLVCQAFLRQFDKRDHDIALSCSEVRAFIEALEALFVKGHVFTKANAPGVPRQPLATDAPLPPACDQASKDKSCQPCFITERVLTQIRTQCVFRAGAVPVLIWGRCSESVPTELAGRIANIAKTTMARLRAEFPEESIRGWLSAFELRLTRLAFGPDRDGSARKQVLRGISQVAGALNLDQQCAVLEYTDAAKYIIAKTAQGQPLAAADAREVWTLLLDDGNLAHVCRKRPAPFTALPLIIRFYLSIEDGECEVERDLGVTRAELACHGFNATNDLLDDKCMLRLCGPAEGTEVLTTDSSGRLGLTPFTRDCATLWIATYGRKMGVRNRVEAVNNGTCGTWVSVKKGVLGAMAKAMVASRLPAVERIDGDTVFGVRRSVLKREAGEPTAKYSNPKMDRFRKLTLKKAMVDSRLEKGNRLSFPKFTPRRAAKEARSIAHVSRVCFLGDCKTSQPLAAKPGTEVVTGAKRCHQAQMVVVDEMSTLHACDDDDMLTHLLYIAGLGKPVVTEASWLLAERTPRALNRRSVVHHVSLALSVQRIFRCTAAFTSNFPGAFRALKVCAALDDSKWKLMSPGQPLAAASRKLVTEVDGVAPLATWLQKETRIVNSLGPMVL
jgi:hypothetical protein